MARPLSVTAHLRPGDIRQETEICGTEKKDFRVDCCCSHTRVPENLKFCEGQLKKTRRKRTKRFGLAGKELVEDLRIMHNEKN